jgi:transposase
MLAAALEANERLSVLAEGLREDNERLRADLAVLQRMLFGRSSERARPEPPPAGTRARTARSARAGRGGRGGGPGGGITRTCPGPR